MSKPTIRELAAKPICCNCGAEIPPKPQGQRGGAIATFCRPGPNEKRSQCQVDFQNRRTARGAAIATWAMAWRADRGSGEVAKGAFEQLCNIVDTFVSEDHAAKRPPARLWSAKQLIQQTNYIDRRHG